MSGFIVFSLPRSRSAWLSNFLGQKAKVAHDLGIYCNAPDDFVQALQPGRFDGTCETGAMFAWRLVQKELPQSKIIVVRRDVETVIESMNRVGLVGHDDEIRDRQKHLEEISASIGVDTISFDDLEKPMVLDWLYGRLLGTAPDQRWVHHCLSVNVQLRMDRRISLLNERHASIEALKQEAKRRAGCLH